jgi:superfamily I DNA/RNA helicase
MNTSSSHSGALRTFVASPEQHDIFTAVADPQGGNLLVQACPGSGKTTTCIHAFEHIPRDADALVQASIAYLVFNKRNADEATGMCPRYVSVSTFHSLGFRALKASGYVPRNVKVDGAKCKRLVWNAMDREDPDVAQVIRFVSLLKGQCEKHPEESLMRDLALRYDMDFSDTRRALRIALSVLEASLRDTSCIDFDDMLWLPVILGHKFSTLDWLFVDEAQDTNDIQIEILERSLGHSSRFVAVGDPHQAIYGFRGANSDALDKIVARFACRTLPLSVSYRCSKAVVAEAQKFE